MIPVLTISFLFGFCSTIHGSKSSKDLCSGYNFEIALDPNRSFIAEELDKTYFKPLDPQFLDLGFSNAAIWLRLSGKQKKQNEKCYIILEWPTLTNVDFYETNTKGKLVLSGQAGTILPRNKWSISWIDHPSFQITSDKDLLIHIETRSIIRFPISLLTETEIREETNRKATTSSMYAGFIGAICLFAFFFFIVLKDQIYLWYLGYILSISLNFGLLYSSAPRLLWPELPFWQNHGVFFTQSLALFFAIGFFREFVDLQTYFPRFDKVAIGLLIFSIIFGIGSFLSDLNFIFSRIFSIVYILWIPTFFTITIRLLAEGQTHLKVFTITWGTFYSAAFIYVLWILRILPSDPFFLYLMIWLFPLEAIFFAASIYQRYKNIDSTRKRLEIEMKAAMDRLAEFSHLTKANSNPSEKKRTEKYKRSKIQKMDVREILSRIEYLFTVETIYRDENLSLNSLAAKLDLTVHQLSEICNTQLNTSFPKFLSYYRIEHASKLLKDPDNLNILEVAYESGFGSKAAFNSEFKRVTGLTPRQFRLLDKTN
ncbi:7TM diverse intracellular signaling domain-containing protein [Leptospira sarikeiensis]|nr:7TM diverse intracellular signaling domain-containing protein [Leptospira sarikeiensis]